jgi:phage/plasmid-associated DNA primase
MALPSNRFEELVDHNKLAFILMNEKQIKEDIHRKARDEVELLAYYKKAYKYNDTTAGVSVCYYQPSNKMFGRYQARGKLSGQGILREVRNTIYADYYYDLDIVNAHPVILLWLCDHYGIVASHLQEYVANREIHISDIISANPGVTRDEVKAVFLSINNGGLASYTSIKSKTEFLIGYKKELQGVIDSIVTNFEYFHNTVKSMKESKGSAFNVNGATISHTLQYVENQLLMIIFKYVEEHIGDKAYNSILCYDGIMILKNYYKAEWLNELEHLFGDIHGIDIKLKIKEMSPLNLTKYGFNENETYVLNYAESLTTDVSSYRSIMDNVDTSKEKALLDSFIDEEDVIQYLRKFGEEYICTDGALYHYNGFYWEVIDSEYIYNLLGFVYVKLHERITQEPFSQDLDIATIEKRKNEKLKSIAVFKKRSFKKSVYEYIREQCSKINNPFNHNIDLIGFTNGVYDLQHDLFRMSRKEDYISMVVPYEYVSSTREDIDYIHDFIRKIMPNDDERELLLLLLSTCLSGYVLDRFVVCTGLGSNGKDALFNYLLKESLGPYFYRGNPTTLTQPMKGDLNVGIANMDKKRAVVFSEPSSHSLVQVALVKEITGGNEINARGLYSSKTSVILHNTIFMLCNDKPMLDKVDAAIARRLLTFHFGSLFKSKEFLEKNDIVDGQGSIFVGDESIKFKPFLTKYRVPFLNLLLPYFQKFKRAGYTITGVPESIEKESQKYMEESDQLYSWFNANYEKTDNKTDVIKLKDVFAGLKESEYYFNLTKAEKRKLTYNSLIEYVERSPLLRMYYKEWTRVDKSAYRNALMGFAIRSNISETPPSEI